MRGLVVLLVGLGAAQAITIGVLPILGRLYDSAAFGRLGAIMAIVSISAVLVHGRYQLAIPVAESEDDARDLLTLALILTMLLSLPVAGVAALASGAASTGQWLPITIGTATFLTILTASLDVAAYWRSRLGKFTATARNAIWRSGTTALAQVALAPAGPAGLLIGAILGACVATVASAADCWRALRLRQNGPNLVALSSVARRYRHYPLFGVPQGWLASLSWNAMPLILMRFEGPAWTGQYWVAYRILVAPVALFNAAYRQSALPRFAEIRDWEARKLVLRDAIGIAILGLIPAFALSEYGDFIFPLVMGSSWHLAGEIAGWMAFGVIADFFKVPMQTLMQGRGLQRRLLMWESALIVLRYGLAVPCLIEIGPLPAVAAFSLVGLAGWTTFVVTEALLNPIRRDVRAG